jgi:hypothetical protein
VILPATTTTWPHSFVKFWIAATGDDRQGVDL